MFRPVSLFVLSLVGLSGGTGAAEPPKVVFEAISATPIDLMGEPDGPVRMAPDGTVHVVSRKSMQLRSARPGAATQVVDLRSAATLAGRSTVVHDLAIGPTETLHLAVFSWQGRMQTGQDLIVVFDRKGAYERTVQLRPSLGMRHMAVDRAGNYYLLAIDAAWFRREADRCLMIHKYAPSGQRLDSFSSCPAIPNLERCLRPGPGWNELSREADLGLLWAGGDSVYHVLPYSHLLREFTLAGNLKREVRLEPPPAADLARQFGAEGSGGGCHIWRLFLISGGRFLVQWVYSETRAHQRGRLPFFAVHAGDGLPLSGATLPPWRRSFPLAVDSAGTCSFLREGASGSRELVIARFDVR